MSGAMRRGAVVIKSLSPRSLAREHGKKKEAGSHHYLGGEPPAPAITLFG